MGLFGKLLKTTIDIATTPFDIISDVATMGGAVNDTESKIATKVRKLKKDVKEMKDEVDKL